MKESGRTSQMRKKARFPAMAARLFFIILAEMRH